VDETKRNNKASHHSLQNISKQNNIKLPGFFPTPRLSLTSSTYNIICSHVPRTRSSSNTSR